MDFNFDRSEPITSDLITMSYNSKKVLSCADSRNLNLHRLSEMSSDGIFDKDNRTSSHLVSIILNVVIMKNNREQIKNNPIVNQHNPELYHEHQSLKK